MRLLHTEHLEFREFSDSNVPKYAILSHCWARTDEEVSYKDFLKGRKRDTLGYRKILDFCREAASLSYQWVWIDTCCIDKRSSAEVSEAINSMFMWYEKSGLCLAYLADVVQTSTWDQFEKSTYFTRGWTLQELLAPKSVTFYDCNWNIIGHKSDSATSIACQKATGIPVSLLRGLCDLNRISVARRMSWAAHRTTTKEEDMAYSLMGIFGVNMPLLYGEGWKSFHRLQLEILNQSDDESLFAWHCSSSPPSAYHGLLARTPAQFSGCGGVVCIKPSELDEFESVTITRLGAWMTRNLSKLVTYTSTSEAIYLCPLWCANIDKQTRYLDGPVGEDVADAGKVRCCSIALARKADSNLFARTLINLDPWTLEASGRPLRSYRIHVPTWLPNSTWIDSFYHDASPDGHSATFGPDCVEKKRKETPDEGQDTTAVQSQRAKKCKGQSTLSGNKFNLLTPKQHTL